MNITNSQIKRLKTALDRFKFKADDEDFYILNDALATLNELEAKRKALNEYTAKKIARKRAEDPLYGRSAEYKQKRMAKMKFDEKGIPYFVDSNPHLGCEWNSCAQFDERKRR